MSTALRAPGGAWPGGRGFARVQRVAWDHPGWWTLAISLAAWLLLAGSGAAAGLPSAPDHAVHAASTVARPAEPLPRVASGLAGWMVMVVAMMWPLVVGPVEFTAGRSLWRRRHRAIAGFLAGYSASWLLAGLVVALGISTLGLDDWIGLPGTAAAAFAVAALWQGRAPRLRALKACHRTAPLAPTGWRAGRDCMRYGCTIGLHCIVSCWASMIACHVAGHGLLAIGGAGAIAAAERYAVRPDQRRHAGALGALAIVYFVQALR